MEFPHRKSEPQSSAKIYFKTLRNFAGTLRNFAVKNALSAVKKKQDSADVGTIRARELKRVSKNNQHKDPLNDRFQRYDCIFCFPEFTFKPRALPDKPHPPAPPRRRGGRGVRWVPGNEEGV
ncbi:MAG: hypothetical protein BWK80_23850 [Desulfobacteraceae bacterium IS3]|nr:MAG: hypothetical protein BWK80_23850 [Desulfobacteraceae bacterium IS3]